MGESEENRLSNEQKPMNDVGIKDVLKQLLYVFVIMAIIFAGISIYEELDSIGWVSHEEETLISARTDWLTGESKDCWSATLNSSGAEILGKDAGYALSSVSCDDGAQHQMKVTFYGRKIQTEYKVVNWRCTREQPSFSGDQSFVCRQTGGQDHYSHVAFP